MTLKPKLQRDPAKDPQPGDIARAGPEWRQILEVRRGKLFVQGKYHRYYMNLPTWREWCIKTKPAFSVLLALDNKGQVG